MMDSTCLVSPMISEDKIKAELDEIFSDGSWESSKSEDSVLPDILIALNKIDSVGHG